MKDEMVIELKSLTRRIDMDPNLDEMTKTALRQLSTISCEMNNGSVDKISDMAQAHLTECRLMIEQMSNLSKLGKDVTSIKSELTELTKSIDKIVDHIGLSGSPNDTTLDKVFRFLGKYRWWIFCVVVYLGAPAILEMFKLILDKFVH